MFSTDSLFYTTLYLFILLLWSSSTTPIVAGNGPEGHTGGTEIFELANLCKGHFPTQMHRRIDGAVIVSKNDKNLDCVVTFTGEYTTQKFLIRFTEFNMECGDRLHIYDSANAIGNSRAELSCRFLGPETINPIKTNSHHVTLRFTADSWGTEANKFTMVITAFKEASKQGCRDAFLCGQDMCITNRLLCDSVQNCLDGSDEQRSANCTSNIFDMITSLDSSLRFGIIGGLIVISTVIVVTCFCFCSRKQNASSSQSPDIYNHGNSRNEASGSNGAGTLITLSDKPGLHSQYQQSTLENLHKSGNLHLPAESQGYTKTRLRRCYMGN